MSKARFVPEDHIPLNNWAKFTMNDMFVHWKLNAGKQIAITTDNGANIKKPVKTSGGQTCRVLVITSTSQSPTRLKNVQRIGRALGICKKIVAAFGTSWKQ